MDRTELHGIGPAGSKATTSRSKTWSLLAAARSSSELGNCMAERKMDVEHG